jgi:hypothetical protein
VNIRIEPASVETHELLASWRYPPPYDFYDGDGEPVLNPRKRFQPSRVFLHVATFNERARRVYERAGFRVVSSHVRTFERRGEVPFVTMTDSGQ